MVAIWAFVVLNSTTSSIMPAVLRMLFHDHPATTAEVGCITMYYLWVGIPGNTGCTHIHIDTVCKSTYWWRVIYVCTSYVYCRRSYSNTFQYLMRHFGHLLHCGVNDWKHDDTCAQPTNHLWFHHSSTEHNQIDIENDLKMYIYIYVYIDMQ